jgi:hypothetical protein
MQPIGEHGGYASDDNTVNGDEGFYAGMEAPFAPFPGGDATLTPEMEAYYANNPPGPPLAQQSWSFKDMPVRDKHDDADANSIASTVSRGRRSKPRRTIF